MKIANRFLLVAVLALVSSLVFASTAYASPFSDCSTAGGSWGGSSSDDGECTYDSSHALALANCTPGESYVEVFIGGSYSFFYCDAGSIIAINPETTCTGSGGAWSGVDSDNGDCTYPQGNATALGICGAGYEYTETFIAGASSGTSCTYVGTSSSEDDSPSGNGDEVKGGGDEPVTLFLGSGNNGSATFAPDACPQKCTIGPNLPAGAKDSLPDNAVATMYVRVVNEGGETGGGSYTVCFKNPEGQPLVIYKFVGGAWVALTFPSNSNQVCVTSSGDGAFYLGG
jgi:hypothetical protein